MSGAERLRGQHLHFDCASGAAGDMTLGALLHLGVPLAVVTAALDHLGLGERLSARPVVKGGLAAIDVTVRTEPPLPHATHVHAAPAPGLAPAPDEHHHHGHGHHHDDDHAHDHAPDAHGHDHHHYAAIRARILAAGLADSVVRRALDIFDRVARAEASLHGVSIDDVIFHEVGAIDSIVDIVGTAAALDWLAPASASAVAVAMGHGTVRCAHGILPVPSPAALEILRAAGAVTTAGGLARELCTPTGAAILAATVTEWRPMPDLVPLAIGFGAGDADFTDRPNVLRLTVGRRVDAMSSGAPVSIYRIEANIDDMSPELCDHAATAAFAAGALDVWWTPIMMKKGRPALQLAALCPASALDAVARAMLIETTTIGVRFDAVERRLLVRREVTVETIYGRIALKVASLDGVEVNAAPEYESCRAAAAAHDVPLKRVFAAAIAAYEDSRRQAG